MAGPPLKCSRSRFEKFVAQSSSVDGLGRRAVGVKIGGIWGLDMAPMLRVG
jgi:hypothetical protein